MFVSNQPGCLRLTFERWTSLLPGRPADPGVLSNTYYNAGVIGGMQIMFVQTLVLVWLQTLTPSSGTEGTGGKGTEIGLFAFPASLPRDTWSHRLKLSFHI